MARGKGRERKRKTQVRSIEHIRKQVIVEEIKRDLKEIKETQINMQVDLREHMRRTDLLEKEVLPVSKFVFTLKVLGAAGMTAISLYGAYLKYFKGVF